MSPFPALSFSIIFYLNYFVLISLFFSFSYRNEERVILSFMKFIYGNKTKFYFFSLTTLPSYLFLTPVYFYLTHIFILIFSFLIKKYALYSYYSDKVTIFFFLAKSFVLTLLVFLTPLSVKLSMTSSVVERFCISLCRKITATSKRGSVCLF